MASIHQNKAGLVGVRSALIGSFLFAVLEVISIKSKEVQTIIELIYSNFSWGINVFIMSSILSIIPGFFGGKIIDRIKKATALSNLSIIGIGVILGVVSVVLISFLDLYIVLAAHNYWSIRNNPAFLVYVKRLIEVVIIAAFMGGWSGYLISKS